MKRNPLNTNHQLLYEDHFHGYPVQTNHGYLITNHLQRIHDCLYRSLERNSSICVMRFDLYVPSHVSVDILLSNAVISKFIASMRAKIKHAQTQSRNEDHRVHDANMRFMWTREISGNGRVHYHVALVFNHAAYAFMGRFNLESNNMFARIHGAWASALGMFVGDMPGYVHVPDNPTYHITRGDEESLRQALYRVSYLAKLQTKEYNQGFHTFGCSNN
ncbi:inovirus Gp2 family protein [Comamonas sediminis]|uniref:Inovirus Gp2 family protein n=1 Tax=Comamonas sediminis TaxID=1783360 RepID=A0ABV4B2Y9_9BURK